MRRDSFFGKFLNAVEIETYCGLWVLGLIIVAALIPCFYGWHLILSVEDLWSKPMTEMPAYQTFSVLWAIFYSIFGGTGLIIMGAVYGIKIWNNFSQGCKRIKYEK